MTDENNEVITEELPQEQGAAEEVEQTEAPQGEAQDDHEDGAEQQEDDASPVIKTIRKQYREQKKELRELRAKLDQYEKPKQEDKLPPRPKLEDVDYDEEAFAEKYEKWLALKQSHEKKIASTKEKEQKQQQSWQAKLQAYEEEKSSITAEDYEDAEEEVIGTLSQIQQSLIVKAAKSPTKIVYALWQDPAKLAALAEIEDPVDFARAIFEIEMGTTTMTQKKVPPPEKRVTSSGGAAPNYQKKLDELREKANQTGSLDEYMTYKRELKKAGKI